MHRRGTCQRALEDEPVVPLQIANEEQVRRVGYGKGPTAGMEGPQGPRSNVTESRDMRLWCMLAEIKAVEPGVDTGTGKLECSGWSRPLWSHLGEDQPCGVW